VSGPRRSVRLLALPSRHDGSPAGMTAGVTATAGALRSNIRTSESPPLTSTLVSPTRRAPPLVDTELTTKGKYDRKRCPPDYFFP
jgi:hypothetical protein